MCGIFGFFTANGHSLAQESITDFLRDLFRLSETRGKEAAGLAVKTNNTIHVHKDSVSASKMLRGGAYPKFITKAFSDYKTGDSLSILGHTRLVTNGLQAISSNNQPVIKDGAVTVHNGIIVNEEALWASDPSLHRQTQVDSEVILALLNQNLAKKQSLPQATINTFKAIQGETSIGVLFADLEQVVLATNTGSLYAVHIPDLKILFFVSEEYIARQAIKALTLAVDLPHSLLQVPANHLLLLNPSNLSHQMIGFDQVAALSFPQISRMLGAQNRIESEDLRLQALRDSLKRCSKCLLPETMPFIEYDGRGICNYCLNYRPQKLSSIEELEKTLSQHRRGGSKPDCLIAFSGGRDSSYGLHLLKKEYGMNPAAYTYDWGMVTPLARRNQARMCGQLGVEHIWVSADIKQKRRFIKMNVEAWLKKPHLGMVPLFMAGDKQFFYHANQIMDQTDIDLMVFCMNNLERTDFKYGFAGIAPEIFDHRSYSLSSLNRLRMLGFYGKEFLLNPRYLNASLLDSFTGFLSWYVLKHNYIYLFNHIEWREEEVDNVLLNQYDWETAPDNPTTWRIGDGTAAFYNYIYHNVAGFTENDALRSNQIREGMITRSWAMERLGLENRTRWESIREYLQLIQVDFDAAIGCIEAIPKLYDQAGTS
jgi:glucosamine--fructose-6-phosphate aminotransferase (isomerizing)